MRIYIDESGPFAVPVAGKLSYCCLGAVVVPDSSYSLFNLEFSQLKSRWLRGGVELKGSSLNERQVAKVIDLASTCGVLFFTCGTEMSHYTEADLEKARDHQADKLLEALTDSHQPSIVMQLNALSSTMKSLPPQLFVQFMLLNELVARVVRATLLHFSLVRPRELAQFHWVIDGKDTSRTEAEVLWQKLEGGLLQSKFLQKPAFGVEGGDTSEFDAAFGHANQVWPDYLPRIPKIDGARNGRILDLKKLLAGSRTFDDSRKNSGLQLADIITNAYRRAIRGNLQQTGWQNLGKLMRRADDEPATGFMHFSAAIDRKRLPFEYAAAAMHIEEQSKYAFEPAFRQFEQ